jgi:hypothetical protein
LCKLMVAIRVMLASLARDFFFAGPFAMAEVAERMNATCRGRSTAEDANSANLRA